LIEVLIHRRGKNCAFFFEGLLRRDVGKVVEEEEVEERGGILLKVHEKELRLSLTHDGFGIHSGVLGQEFDQAGLSKRDGEVKRSFVVRVSSIDFTAALYEQLTSNFLSRANCPVEVKKSNFVQQ
jgi:hypothetical protein